MNNSQSTETMLRPYLLGQLSEHAQELVETGLMTDAKLVEELRIAEEDLADDYAAGTLQGADKERFERLFLENPDRRRRAAFALALHTYLSPASAGPAMALRPKSSWRAVIYFLSGQSFGFKAAVAFIFVAAALAGGVLVYNVTVLQHRLNGMTAREASDSAARQTLAGQLQQERERNERLLKEIAGLPPASKSQSTAGFVAITLLPGLVRDAAGGRLLRQIIFSPDAESAQLELVLPPNETYTTYDALLQTAEGDQTWNQTGLPPTRTSAGLVIVARVPRAALKPQDYLLKITGKNAAGSAEPAGTYYFRVAAK